LFIVHCSLLTFTPALKGADLPDCEAVTDPFRGLGVVFRLSDNGASPHCWFSPFRAFAPFAIASLRAPPRNPLERWAFVLCSLWLFPCVLCGKKRKSHHKGHNGFTKGHKFFSCRLVLLVANCSLLPAPCSLLSANCSLFCRLHMFFGSQDEVSPKCEQCKVAKDYIVSVRKFTTFCNTETYD
jgi:hypothetical protein